ncbi:MAG: hypothetical protein WBG86_17415, partial [Polyangiales bacterium]
TPPRTTRVRGSRFILLWARLYGWQSDRDAEVARAYLDFASEKSPESPEVTLHWSAFEVGAGAVDAADARIARALELAPSDPDVLAAATRWFGGSGADREAFRRELLTWCEALEGSAQTAFQFTVLGECTLRVRDVPRVALRYLDQALMLDSTSWRAFALAGEALEALDRPEQAIRAYSTAIGLSGHRGTAVRDELRQRIDRLR